MTEMTHLGELKRIEAAIVQRNQAELQWAHDFCRAQTRAAIPNEDKGAWKRRQGDVSRVLRELRVTEDQISAHEWSSYHRETLKESNVCGCFYCVEVFSSSQLKHWTDEGDT